MPSYGRPPPFALATRYRASNAATRIQSVIRKKQSNAKRTKNLQLNPVVKTLVDKRIKSDKELHSVGLHQVRRQIDNLPNTQQRVWQVIPDVTVGSSRSQREGAEIKMSSLKIQGCITIPADDNPILVNGDRADLTLRLLCLSAKKFKSFLQIQNNWSVLDQLYDKLLKPNAQSEPFVGMMTDIWQPINHDAFTTHYDKTFRLKRGIGYFPDPTSSSGAAHMPAINHPFTINLKCKNKKLTYQDAANDFQNNFAPFVIATWAYTNGQLPSGSGVPFVEYWSQMYFYP